jgi:RHS repeat-associated protein
MDDATRNNPYQYNGKELNEDFGLGWMDYGARWYDATLGRFPSVDPIISEFPYLTPYNYASNSPITNIDLWGLQGQFFMVIGPLDMPVKSAEQLSAINDKAVTQVFDFIANAAIELSPIGDAKDIKE